MGEICQASKFWFYYNTSMETKGKSSKPEPLNISNEDLQRSMYWLHGIDQPKTPLRGPVSGKIIKEMSFDEALEELELMAKRAQNPQR